MKHIIKPAATLFCIAAVVTALLGLVYELTREPRENQQKKLRELTMKEVMAQASDFEKIDITPSGTIVGVYKGLSPPTEAGGDTIGYVIELETKEGYGDTISMMVGISTGENVITGMRVMKHSETPGLGALAAHENFHRQFDGKRPVPLRVVKGSSAGEDEIDAISGATITTKAITNAVNEAIEWYNARAGQ